MSTSTSTESVSVFNARDQASTLLSINMSNITKLSNLNYIMWSRQIKALLEGHELQGFIDESTETPTPTIIIDGQTTTNPSYAPWRRQDRLLYSDIIGSISLPIQPLVSMATTTYDVLESMVLTLWTVGACPWL